MASRRSQRGGMNIWLRVLPLNWETDGRSVGAFQECRLLRRLKSDGPLSARLETLIIRRNTLVEFKLHCTRPLKTHSSAFQIEVGSNITGLSVFIQTRFVIISENSMRNSNFSLNFLNGPHLCFFGGGGGQNAPFLSYAPGM